MGRLGSRIVRLEDHSKEQAKQAYADLMNSLSDEEVALLVLGSAGIELSSDQEEIRERATAKLKGAGIDGILQLAVRPEKCASEEEINIRIKEALDAWAHSNERLEQQRLLISRLGGEQWRRRWAEKHPEEVELSNR